MDKNNNLLNLLYKLNFWDKPNTRSGIQRDLLNTIENYIEGNQVLILQGIRRAGKSTLLFQIMQQLVAKGIDCKQILYVNFEEPFFAKNNSIEILDNIYQTYRENINLDHPSYFFFDEIQNIEKWEHWVRAKNDLKEAKIFITGSSSKLLSREIGTLLTGRHVSFSVWPLSFKEFLRFKDLEILNSADMITHQTKIRSLLKEYLHFGGMPEIAFIPEEEKKETILKQYFEDILFRDVVGRHQIRDVATLRKLAINYMTNVSNLNSYNKLKNIFGTPLDVIRNYTAYMTESYLLHELPKFSFKVREQQIAPKKIYAADLGMRNGIAFRFSEDLGRLAENAVFNFLRLFNDEIYYAKEKNEVDFIIKKGMKITQAIQVCYDNLEDSKILERGLKGLKETVKTYKLKEAIIITNDKKDSSKEEGLVVHYIPLSDYLLSR